VTPAAFLRKSLRFGIVSSFDELYNNSLPANAGSYWNTKAGSHRTK
jgi:hypothetical protein